MANFNLFSKFKNFFSRLKHSTLFHYTESDSNDICFSSKELLKRTIENYSNFEKVLMVAFYHLFNTQNVNIEYLTVLTKDKRLICDLVKGDECSVQIPEILKKEPIDNILLTCHNHFHGAIIPSKHDFKNILKPKIKFTIIVSEDNIGILVNELGDNFFKLSKEQHDELCNNWKSYLDYILFSMANDKPELIFNLFGEEFSQINDDEFQEIFESYVGENISKFIDEFNVRFKKYNMYYIHIEL